MSSIKRSPILGYNHNVRYAGRLWHIQTEDSGVSNPRIFTHLFHEGTILATKRSDYDPTQEVHVVQKLMQEQHKQLLRELKGGAFDEKIARFFGVPVTKEGEAPAPAPPPPELPPPMAPPVDFARSSTLLAGDSPSLVPNVDPLPGPMTDPSMPVVQLPVAEPALYADDEESLEIRIEPGSLDAPAPAKAPTPQPSQSGSMPIPPVPSVPRQPSMPSMRPPSVPGLPRYSPGSTPTAGTQAKLPSMQPAQTASSSTPQQTRQPSAPVQPAQTERSGPLPNSPRIVSPVGGVPKQGNTPAPTTVPQRAPSRPNQQPYGAKPSPLSPQRSPSGPKSSPSPLRSPSGNQPPPSSDDPLSQIPLFAAAPTPAPQTPTPQQPPQRRDAMPLRVPTRTGGQKVDSPVAPRRPSSTDAQGVPRRQSQSHGVVKPTSEGVVVARPAVVIGGAAPPANAPRPQRPTGGNRWHQSGPGQPPQGQGQQRGKGFGSDLISERSLDEVILAYLSEDAKDK